MNKRWMLSDSLMGVAAKDVDFEAGVIRGAAIATVGPAKGHGVNLDQGFIESVVSMGNDQGNGGIKVRFGHPTMCGNALLDAPFIGRAKNFSVDGNIARADIFLSNSASETPAGDLRSRTLNLAAEDPDMFGTSIVFTASELYKIDDDGEKVMEGERGFRDIDGDPFITIAKLHGADIVDTPAANEGLFSAINPDAFSVQATQFLDNNPKLWDLIIESPEIVKEFMARYEMMVETRNKPNEETTMLDDQTIEQPAATEVPAEVELAAVEDVQTETFAAEPAEVVEVPEQPIDFKELYDSYGAAFADYAYSEKLTAGEAKDAYIAYLQDRIEDQDKRLAAMNEIGEDAPAEFAAVVADADPAKAAADAKAEALINNGVSPGVARFASKLKIK